MKVPLEAGADVNLVARDRTHRTLLMSACDSGRLELLFELGAEINYIIERHDYRTTLEFSCYNGCLEIVKFLLDSRVYVNAPPHPCVCGIELLAAWHGNSAIVPDIVRLLIKSRAWPDVTCDSCCGLALGAASKCWVPRPSPTSP